jgi:hypothetical protein
VELKFKITDVLLGSKIVKLGVVIHVKNFKLESLTFFKEVVHREVDHKVWVEIVIDDLCFTNKSLNWLSALLLQLI